MIATGEVPIKIPIKLLKALFFKYFDTHESINNIIHIETKTKNHNNIIYIYIHVPK